MKRYLDWHFIIQDLIILKQFIFDRSLKHTFAYNLGDQSVLDLNSSFSCCLFYRHLFNLLMLIRNIHYWLLRTVSDWGKLFEHYWNKDSKNWNFLRNEF